MNSISSPDDKKWFAQLTALKRNEITLEQIPGFRNVFRQCACGVVINKNSKRCPDCTKMDLINYCAGLTERIKTIPLIECPLCRTRRYTKLCSNGFCYDCNFIAELRRENERYAKAKPKSLLEKVKNFTSFVEMSEPKETEISDEK